MLWPNGGLIRFEYVLMALKQAQRVLARPRSLRGELRETIPHVEVKEKDGGVGNRERGNVSPIPDGSQSHYGKTAHLPMRTTKLPLTRLLL